MKKIKVKTPSGRLTFHKRREKTNFLVCSKCGVILHGTPGGTRQQLKNLALSEKVPSRPYGSQLCSACVKNIFREKARLV